MPGLAANLDQFNTPDILRVVWDTFADFAKCPEALNSATHFNLVGENKSVCARAFEKCSKAGLIPSNIQTWTYPPFKHVVMRVYYSALNMGLLLPSRLDQELNWNQHMGPFHFTADGVKYFSEEGFISLDDPGQLATVLQELKQRVAAIQDGQIELLLEAQRCIRSGCYRAAMVVMGVASEDACIALVDAIQLHCQAPAASSHLYSDWNNSLNTSLAFSARWKPAIRLLEAIKKQLRVPGKGESWWQWWELVSGSLFTVGEAVRVARNAAAHDTQRKFSRGEVALLLTAMPTQLEMIANLTDFLTAPPSHLQPIQIK